MKREEAIKRIQQDLDVSKKYLSKEYKEALNMAIEALSAEPTDLISRADAIKAIESRQTEQWIDADVDYNNGLESAVVEIKALPSADRPSGEWVIVNKGLDIYICDQCGEVEQIQRIPIWDYCPNCGAKMVANIT